jgi:hypothetical protein
MAYQHDIFISYKRDYIGDRWLIEQFLPHFRKFVANDIKAHTGRTPMPIFFDQSELPASGLKVGLEGIEPGEEWKPRLATALEHSRCLVALCTPLYFSSPWCAIEWETFAQRARSTNKTVIVPVSIHDGDSFPEHARKLQLANLARYWIDRLDHDHTLYSPFQQEVRTLAERVARVVANAPEFAGWRAATSADVTGEPLIGKPVL